MANKLPINNKKKQTIDTLQETSRIESLHKRIVSYIESGRTNIIRSVNTEMVRSYWLIGKAIVEEE